jgi:hypothetical protein
MPIMKAPAKPRAKKSSMPVESVADIVNGFSGKVTVQELKAIPIPEPKPFNGGKTDYFCYELNRKGEWTPVVYHGSKPKDRPSDCITRSDIVPLQQFFYYTSIENGEEVALLRDFSVLTSALPMPPKPNLYP